MSIELKTGNTGNFESDVNSNNALNGKGSDVKIGFNISSNPEIPTLDKNSKRVVGKQRPNEIGLGHELIHGIRSMEGKAIAYNKIETYSYINSEGQKVTVNGRTEELETVGIKGTFRYSENKLRVEHGLEKRGAY
jgi:hypothetical protein